MKIKDIVKHLGKEKYINPDDNLLGSKDCTRRESEITCTLAYVTHPGQLFHSYKGRHRISVRASGG